MKKKIAGLLMLSAVPMLAGVARLFSLSNGAIRLDGHERFAADPFTAALHIIGVTSFATLGAFQFVPALRRGTWHRRMGRVLSLLGISAVLAGTIMALRWPPKEFDSAAFNAIRVLIALAMVTFIALGVMAARRRNIEAHRSWMLRAYALFLGSGTQVITAGFTALPFMQPHLNKTLNAAAMTAGWLINALVAEWLLRRPGVVVQPCPTTNGFSYRRHS